MADTFGVMLNAHRTAIGLSQNALAHRIGVDPAYINRIERGLWSNRSKAPHMPSRPVVLRLAAVLCMDAAETDRLLFLAGHAPERDYQALYEAHERTLARISLMVDGLAVMPASLTTPLPVEAVAVTSTTHTNGEALVFSAAMVDPDLPFVRRSA